ncbi:MAG: acylphosphatase [Pseudomonadota bacterium]
MTRDGHYEHRSVRVLISGRVQGVGFRYASCRAAKSLGLGGWVRNLTDGRVEMLLSGTHTQVEKMIEWSHSGPAYAEVTDVHLQECAFEPISDFTSRQTK